MVPNSSTLFAWKGETKFKIATIGDVASSFLSFREMECMVTQRLIWIELSFDIVSPNDLRGIAAMC